jgi:hypothetical protein
LLKGHILLWVAAFDAAAPANKRISHVAAVETEAGPRAVSLWVHFR